MGTDLNTPRDLNDVLAEGIAAIYDWEAAESLSQAEHVAAERATRCFAEIDAALRDHGRLPDAWGYAMRPWSVIAEHGPLPTAQLREAAAKRSCGDPECTNPSHLISAP